MLSLAMLSTEALQNAIENERTLNQQLMQLLDAAAGLLPSPDTRNVLERIISLAQRFVSANGCAVWRRSSRVEAHWSLVSSSGLSDEFVRHAIVDDQRQTHALQSQSPLIVEDITLDPMLRARRGALEREGIRSMLVIPLQIQGDLTGTVTFYWTERHSFSDSEIRIARALGNLAAAALGTVELYERETELRNQAERSQSRAAFLAEAGAILASSLDFEDTLRSVARLAIGQFADWCAVDIAKGGKLDRVTLEHADPAKLKLARQFRQRYPPREDDVTQIAFQTGQAVLIETIPEELLRERVTDPDQLAMIQEMGIASFMVTPMVNRGHIMGLITFVSSNPSKPYTAMDLELAKELARRAATAIDNASLYAESQTAQAALRQTNQELVQANEDLSQFAYSVSHDLQEPLRMISIYCELLGRRHGEQFDEQARQYLRFAIQGARQMEALIRDILTYTRVSNSVDESSAPLDAGVVLEKVLATLQESIQAKSAIIDADPLPVICYPEVHLLQVFQNLIGNAIKYAGPTTPQIRIEAVRQGYSWLFSVSDNGIGIETQYQEKIFALFQRLRVKDQEGTGLGLAICKRIVERNGGRIWVESRPGQGSTFFFTVPDQSGQQPTSDLASR